MKTPEEIAAKVYDWGRNASYPDTNSFVFQGVDSSWTWSR